MLREIVRKELLDHLMSLRFAIACILCFVVILCSLFVRHQDYAQTLSAYHEETAAQRVELNKMSRPSHLIWRGVRVHTRPNPLKIFARGVDDQNGMTVNVNCRRPPDFETADIASPLHLLFPPIDMVTFVGVIMSLLAIVFGYDAVCGEKERGTLRLMLSYSVPRDTVLAAKWIGGYLTLVIPFLIAALAGAAIVLMQPNVSLNAGQWGRLIAVLFMALLYIAAVFSAAMWVSCVTSLSATSIMILVTLWMVFVLAIPNLSPFLGAARRHVAGLEEIETIRREKGRDIWRTRVSEGLREYDRTHGIDSAWWKKVNWRDWESRKPVEERQVYRLGLEKTATLERLRMFSRVEEKFVHDLDRQIQWGRWLSRLSPFSCFALAVTELTDTGVQSKRRFLDQIRAYQRRLSEYAYDERIRLRSYRLEHDGEEAPAWDENRPQPIPEFAYVPPAGTQYLKIVLVDAGILAGMIAIFFLLSVARFLRYDVR